MNFASGFLRSKVARRFFLLFICCALLPMVALTILSFNQVIRQLELQSHKRLQEQTKAYGMSVYERLMLLDTDLEVMAAHALMAKTTENATEHFHERLEQRFAIMSEYRAGHPMVDIVGHMIDPPKLDPAESEALHKGQTVIIAHPRPDLPAQLFIIKPVHPGTPEEFILYGEIIPSYVWGLGSENFLPSQTELFVLDMTKKLLISSHAVPENLVRMVALRQEGEIARQFEYQHGNDTYLASYWPIFLKSKFFSQTWTVVLGQAKSEVLAPLAHFSKIFPLVVLLSLWIVLLLSLVFIRRTLAPVEVLKEGTQRVGRRDFSTRVSITSGDEFQELASSFNNMTSQLDQQFKAMSTRAEIDRAILSSLDSGKIINTALTNMYDFFGCDLIAFSLINPLQENTAQVFSLQNPQQKKPALETLKISEADAELLTKNATYLLCDGPQAPLDHLSVFTEKGIQAFLLLPVFLKNRLAGFITLGSRGQCSMEEEKLQQARHLADQLAVALSNARLIEDMEHLTLGTIEALARTVDAKSSWTSGHSERVAETAVKIARAMGWADKQVETLFRGGLLHDIGKIGIPLAILDKPDKLTDAEYTKVKDHPAIGAKILEPIKAYADIIPMVIQHHERYDGKGYPNGLAGQAIDINARILAVADVYDALISSRPYRQGWIEDKVISLLKNEASRQFDPDVVEAFLGILATRSMHI
ncbi:MAG: HD domain-containing protein [Proteobacteria bacterium]|nr:HD domain-containing protein [Pseudomonadota bacterium]MBU4298077.1 HD domain-containing protein [Pseudomonadota bacterium]MCG2746312.1 HD domain-containing protein [Desulfobulbaceae bacterium]